MGTQNGVGLLISEDFHEAIGVTVGPGAAVGRKRKLTHVVGGASFFELFFGLSHRGHFRPCVDDAGDGIVIDMARLTGDELHASRAFFLCLVGQHRPANHVTNGKNTRDVGLEMMVNFDKAALVHLHPGLGEAQLVSEGLAANGDEHHVGLDFLRLATLGGRRRQLDTAWSGFRRCHPGGEFEFQALFFEDAQHGLGNFSIHTGQDVVEEFNHGDLGPQTTPDRTHFQPDDACADDDHGFWNLGQGQRAGGADDACLIDFNALQRRHVGAGGDEDIPGFDNLFLGAFLGGVLDANLARFDDTPGTDQVVHLVFLEQELYAFGQVFDDLVLATHHGFQIDAQAAGLYAVIGELVARHFIVMG